MRGVAKRIKSALRNGFATLVVDHMPASFGYEIKERLMGPGEVPSMRWSLENMQHNGFRPERIVDIGAHEGESAVLFKSVYPDAKVLMVEAQHEKRAHLDKIAARYMASAVPVTALLGAEDATNVAFYRHPTADMVSSALPGYHDMHDMERQERSTITLDTLLHDKEFLYPQMLKLDVQGYELEILKGGKTTIGNAEVIILEVSLLELIKGAPLLHDVVPFMADREFVAYDICTFHRRPLDNALWQIDVVFVRNDSKLIESRKWG